MKYYSEVTRTTYNTAAECIAAEKAHEAEQKREEERRQKEALALKEKKEKEAAARKEAAAKVEEARKVMVEAQKAYRDALTDFCANYGTYHASLSSVHDIPTLFSDFFNFF